MWFPSVGIFVCVSSIANAQYILGLAEGEICNDKQEGQWVCTAYKQCTHIDLKITRPGICSFRGRDPIICCPPKKKTSKAEISCLKHTDLCNQFNTFREAAGGGLPGKTSEWTADEDNEAEVLEAPVDAMVERHRRSEESDTTTLRTQSTTSTETTASTISSTSTQSTETSRTFIGEDMVTSTTAPVDIGVRFTTPESNTDNSTMDVPKPRQYYVVGGCAGYVAEVPCSMILKRPEIHISVVGGKLAKGKTQRYMALIGYGPKNDIDWRCGGSLISDLWVLSAAHCTTTTDLGSAKWARVGELDHSTNTDDARPQDRRIVQRINHPQYKAPLKYNDIALYKLESRVLFDQFVAPICLHTTFEIDQPKATVVGWGRTDFADDLSSRLMEVDITLINSTECRRLYGTGDYTTPRGIDGTTMVCAGEKEGGKDACTGDSGGPMVINQPGSCLKKQVGITSFGRDCGLPNSPGIYTRVSTYVPWIESIVWP